MKVEIDNVLIYLNNDSFHDLLQKHTMIGSLVINPIEDIRWRLKNPCVGIKNPDPPKSPFLRGTKS